MKEQLQKLVDIIKLAQRRGAYTLEESAYIYQVLTGLNKCPVLQPIPQTQHKDLDMIIEDEDEEME